MHKITITLLLGSGMLLLLRYADADDLTAAYLGALILFLTPVALILRRGAKRRAYETRANALMKEAQGIAVACREARSKIPKNAPRRDSPAAFLGSTRVRAARSMAEMLRKPQLRQRILDICDFADLVLETIRRMPDDTPAAVSFSETLLPRLTDSLDRYFDAKRREEQAQDTPSVDTYELECFSAFLSAFRKQQDCILLEGTALRKG